MKYYFLFGGEAADILGGGGTLEAAVRAGCETRLFDTDTDDVSVLLADYTGWNDFWTLTEEEYNKINELIEETR